MDDKTKEIISKIIKNKIIKRSRLVDKDYIQKIPWYLCNYNVYRVKVVKETYGDLVYSTFYYPQVLVGFLKIKWYRNLYSIKIHSEEMAFEVIEFFKNFKNKKIITNIINAKETNTNG